MSSVTAINVIPPVIGAAKKAIESQNKIYANAIGLKDCRGKIVTTIKSESSSTCKKVYSLLISFNALENKLNKLSNAVLDEEAAKNTPIPGTSKRFYNFS